MATRKIVLPCREDRIWTLLLFDGDFSSKSPKSSSWGDHAKPVCSRSACTDLPSMSQKAVSSTPLFTQVSEQLQPRIITSVYFTLQTTSKVCLLFSANFVWLVKPAGYNPLMSNLAFDSKYKGGICYVACQEVFAWQVSDNSLGSTHLLCTAERVAISPWEELTTHKRELLPRTCARDTPLSYTPPRRESSVNLV